MTIYFDFCEVTLLLVSREIRWIFCSRAMALHKRWSLLFLLSSFLWSAQISQDSKKSPAKKCRKSKKRGRHFSQKTINQNFDSFRSFFTTSSPIICWKKWYSSLGLSPFYELGAVGHRDVDVSRLFPNITFLKRTFLKKPLHIRKGPLFPNFLGGVNKIWMGWITNGALSERTLSKEMRVEIEGLLAKILWWRNSLGQKKISKGPFTLIRVKIVLQVLALVNEFWDFLVPWPFVCVEVYNFPIRLCCFLWSKYTFRGRSICLYRTAILLGISPNLPGL